MRLLTMKDIYAKIAEEHFRKSRKSSGEKSRSKGKKAANRIYKRVKEITPNISAIYTDEESCYDVVFANQV